MNAIAMAKPADGSFNGGRRSKGALRAGLGLVGILLLASCATTPKRPSAPTASVEALNEQREKVLEWSLEGRIAVANGNKGGSGRLDWQQEAGRYVISLSAPVTRQSWRLIGDSQSARLEGVEGGTREGADVQQLLREATGWEIPIGALSNWMRGIGAAADEYGPAKLAYGADNLPLRLEQAGWTVEYAGWAPVSNGPWLPSRLVATQGKIKVRLVMDTWNLNPDSGSP